MDISNVLEQLGVCVESGSDLAITTPIDGSIIATLACDTTDTLDHKLKLAETSFDSWRDVPAPKRGEAIRLFGNMLRQHKEPLAQLVTIECGKILEEGRGEVQEMIDICDFAVGLSRQLYGLTIASERPQHVMQENWLPLGSVGVISAFNFPVAVWAWNFALAIVCGDSVLWKPSEKTPLCALACQHLFEQATKKLDIPKGLSQIVIGKADLGKKMVDDARMKLISATGSCRMGGLVGPVVAKRFGKSLLELGGNNAVIVSDKADLDIAIPSIVFGAVGTAGQRCTTTRRVIVHKDIYDEFLSHIKNHYQQIIAHNIGSPLEDSTLIGPLIDKNSLDNMQSTLKEVAKQGGSIFFGNKLDMEGCYVEPAIVAIDTQTPIVQQECFAPILYIIPYVTLEDALSIHNDVPQGLSSAIFTTDMREAEYFKQRSDCGIANVNIGTSGAEIGGAFGGEKETGGGRESGSDAWKNYMRRQTSTSYYGTDKPALAQGISFT